MNTLYNVRSITFNIDWQLVSSSYYKSIFPFLFYMQHMKSDACTYYPYTHLYRTFTILSSIHYHRARAIIMCFTFNAHSRVQYCNNLAYSNGQLVSFASELLVTKIVGLYLAQSSNRDHSTCNSPNNYTLLK